MTSSATPDANRGLSTAKWFAVASLVVGGFAAAVGFRGISSTGSAATDIPPARDLAEADVAVRSSIERAREVVRRSPDDSQAWGELGTVLLAHGLLADASTCFERAEQLDSQQWRWPYLRAECNFEVESQLATDCLVRAADLRGSDGRDIRLRLAELLTSTGRLEAADRQLGHVRQVAPDHPRYHLTVARLRLAQDRIDAALEHAQMAAPHPRAGKAAHLLIAQIHQRNGQLQLADRAQAAAAACAVAPWPNEPMEAVMARRVGFEPRLRRAQELVDHGNLTAAIRSLEDLVFDHPHVTWAWIVYGRSLARSGNLRAARDAFRKAVRLDSESVEAHYQLGVVHTKRNEDRQATRRFQRALRYQPNHAQSRLELGRSYSRRGDRWRAIKAYRMVIELEPKNAEAHALLGRDLADIGQSGRALAHLSEAKRLGFDEGWLDSRLGELSRSRVYPPYPR